MQPCGKDYLQMDIFQQSFLETKEVQPNIQWFCIRGTSLQGGILYKSVIGVLEMRCLNSGLKWEFYKYC